MTGYASLLKGINVGGSHRVRMEDLKDLYTSLGARNVSSYIQSGNVVFEHSNRDAESLAESLASKLKMRYGFEIPVFIRTRTELEKLVKNNPYAGKDEMHIHVTFLSEKPRDYSLDRINNLIAPRETFVLAGKEGYLYCPDGYGRTKLQNSLFEKEFKVTATTRNWRTTQTLLSLIP